MKSIKFIRFYHVAFYILLVSFSGTGQNFAQSPSLEDFFVNFKNAIEAQDEKSISSFYDQTQVEFFSREISKWKNTFYAASPKALKVKYFSLGGDGSERIVMYDFSSSNPIFNMLFSNTIHPYILHKTNDGWKFYRDISIKELYIPMAEEINVAIRPLIHEMNVVQKIKIKSTQEKVLSVIFIINDELRVDSCSEEGKKLGFEQFGYLLRIDRPLKKSGEQLELLIKYGGKVEKYRVLNDHYIGDTGGILRSENFWHLSLASYEEYLPRPIKLTIDVPADFNAVSDGGHLAFSKKEGNRLVQRWDIPPDETLFIGFIFYNGWNVKDYNTGINRLYLCLDKNSKLEDKKIIELVLDIVSFYKQTFGAISLRDYYILDYDFGFHRKNYVPARADILPHELSHLWWAFPGELWLTEGFAEYADALYLERSKGHEAFLKRLNALKQELIRILESGLDLPLAGSGYNQLIYKKGALVVQALRLELGESLFFKTLQNFISKFHNKDAKWKDFYSIAETTTERNLSFFFDQWLLRPGLPNIELEYDTVQDGKSLKINGRVIQEGLVYRLSSKLEISGQGLREEHELMLDKSEVSFTFPVSFRPEFVDIKIGEGVPCILKGAGLSAKKGNLEAEGMKALNDHNYKKALKSFSELLNLPLEKEENALTCYRIGKTLFGLGKYLEAEDQFKRAVGYAELPQDYHCATILYLGKSNLCYGDRKKAKEYFGRLIAEPGTPEDYKTEAERFSQYLGLLRPPPNEVTEFVEDLQAAINNKNGTAIKALSLPLSKEAEMRMLLLVENNPLEDFRIKIELVLDAGSNKYYVECFATGALGKRIVSGDVILLLQKVNGQIRLIDLIRIDMN